MLIARGDDLELLAQAARLTGTEAVLDVGTAAGGAALRLAPLAGSVVGVDMVTALLDQAARSAAEQHLHNVRFTLGDAGRLPFEAASFDLVVSRMSGHHFPDPAAFCREAARVLRPGGRLLVVDNVAPEAGDLDGFINGLEKLRDPHHVRAWKRSEWEAFMASAGLEPRVLEQFHTPEPLPDWWLRTQTAPAATAEIRHRLETALPHVRQAFSITDGSFCLHRAILAGHK